MDTADRLLAIEEIKQLKARYFRFMDTKDWEGLRTIFCEHAEFDARAALSIDGQGNEGQGTLTHTWIFRGRDAIVDFIKGATGSVRTVHFGHCHEVNILSPSEASGVIALEDQIWDVTGKIRSLHGCGHYHETYKREGCWRIFTSRLSRLHVTLG